jgi:hypothetical protein
VCVVVNKEEYLIHRMPHMAVVVVVDGHQVAIAFCGFYIETFFIDILLFFST